MRTVLCLLLPPLGLLSIGRPFQALGWALVLFVLIALPPGLLIGWPVASIWALSVLSNWRADRRQDRLVRELTRARGLGR